MSLETVVVQPLMEMLDATWLAVAVLLRFAEEVID